MLFVPLAFLSLTGCNSQQLSEAELFTKHLGQEGTKLVLRDVSFTTTEGIPGSTYNQTDRRLYSYEFNDGNLIFNTFRHVSFSGSTSKTPFGFAAKLTFKLGHPDEGTIFTSRYDGYSIEGRYSFSNKGELVLLDQTASVSYEIVLTDLKFLLQYNSFATDTCVAKTPDGNDRDISIIREQLFYDINSAIHDDFCGYLLKEYKISPEYIFTNNQ